LQPQGGSDTANSLNRHSASTIVISSMPFAAEVGKGHLPSWPCDLAHANAFPSANPVNTPNKALALSTNSSSSCPLACVRALRYASGLCCMRADHVGYCSSCADVCGLDGMSVNWVRYCLGCVHVCGLVSMSIGCDMGAGLTTSLKANTLPSVEPLWDSGPTWFGRESEGSPSPPSS